jgi:hypothetical protein
MVKSEIIPIDGAICIACEFDRTLDHTQILAMAQAVEDAMEADTDLRLLLDLRRTEKFALGAFLSPKGFLASVKSIGPVSRYAVVGAPAMVATAVEVFGTIMPLQSKAFAAVDYAAARRWVMA